MTRTATGNTVPLLFAALLMASQPSSTAASFAPVPLEVLVDQADLVVVGKVGKVQDAGFAVGTRRYDAAVVTVEAVLKSPPKAKRPKEVRVGQPGRGGIALGTDIRFRVGQQGMWLLTKDPTHDVYWARHPSQFQQIAERERLVELVKARAKLPGGKAVNGLVARAELFEATPAKGPTTFEVRFSLKNVSDKPITIFDYVGDQPLSVKWIGPDGKARNSSHYAWLAFADLAGPRKQNFVTLPPGGVRYLGPQGMHSGILFQPAAGGRRVRGANAAEQGKHRVTVRYTNRSDGKGFGIKNVWTGTAIANEVTFTVK